MRPARYSLWLLAMAAMTLSCSGGRTTLIVDADMVAIDQPLPADERSQGDLFADDQFPELTVQDTADNWTFDLVADDSRPDLLMDLGPQPGEFGYPCQTDAQCNSGLCVLSPDGTVCTVPCVEECPPGWSCGLHKPSLPDEVYVCVPASMSLCRPCLEHADCHLNGVDLGDECAGNANSGYFCASPCMVDNDCPAQYHCNDGLCRPLGGECACTKWFIDDGATTSCTNENAAGICQGVRSCQADGLTPCSAPLPAPESCNLLDDDCDGLIDEESAGAQCLVENEYGACPGTQICANGLLACDGPDASLEACDGKDNDCDGETDEGFPDTDMDGLADCMETDKDGDGVVDGSDNCPGVANPDQADFDLDGNGDGCDLDDDNDLVADALDCAPFDPDINPKADELCDGKDNDCDELVDEELGEVTCGQGNCHHTVAFCLDGQVQFCNPFAGATAESCDGADNDCDGLVDEDLGQLSCGLGNCFHSLTACIDGIPQTCDALAGATAESCDGQDNDCDGLVDEGLGTTTCGLGICLHTVPNCVEAAPVLCDPGEGAQEETCNGLDDDCDGDTDEEIGVLACGLGECFHTVPKCLDGQTQLCDPMAGSQPELCDGKDNDCDGDVDEDLGDTTCGLGICLHTTVNCDNGFAMVCDPGEGAQDETCNGLDDDCDGEIDEGFADTDNNGLPDCIDPDDDGDDDPDVTDCAPLDPSIGHGMPEVCFNQLDDNCDGVQDDICVGSTCAALLQDYPGLASGAYSIDPDGDGGNPPFRAWCDMSTDGGGWTLVSWYQSNLELHIFNPTQHQIQSASNGAIVATPPEVWQDDVFGHVAYGWLPVAGKELKMECRKAASGNWFSYVRSNLFANWNDGDKGNYGAGAGWGVLRWTSGRSSHWVCGKSLGPQYGGIAYCKGPGVGGSFSNHIVSTSFDPLANYGGGTAMGCNGTGINEGKSGKWQTRMWVR